MASLGIHQRSFCSRITRAYTKTSRPSGSQVVSSASNTSKTDASYREFCRSEARTLNCIGRFRSGLTQAQQRRAVTLDRRFLEGPTEFVPNDQSTLFLTISWRAVNGNSSSLYAHGPDRNETHEKCVHQASEVAPSCPECVMEEGTEQLLRLTQRLALHPTQALYSFN
jgi:hypothetical protein